ncbi:hypothetical protein [Noviherbaspirillum malthae]|uniref:hypothetical protein n=1 Tax=Noviherbaspirillum malthae TaxID=1260987 RepID=UPI00188E17A4|nr:hypothetical protein [Noviherbaspirillum malthae]
MHIVAIAWIYVVLMMSITEHSVIAGIMTFLLYGVLPLTIILYLMGTPQRKRNRARAEKLLLEEAAAAKQAEDAAKEKEDRRDAP